LFTVYFGFLIVGVSFLSYMYPGSLKNLTYLITPSLGVIMFGMGMTLTRADFKRVVLRPHEVALGVFAQYGIMPFVGFVIARFLRLEPLIAVGVVVVGSCPGGTASNVITYFARGDVALSVTMTSVSTLLSPVFTPALVYLLAGKWVEVPVMRLFLFTLQIVLFPVALGVFVRGLLGSRVNRVLGALPVISSITIIFIVGVIIGASADSLHEVGLRTIAAVVIHNTVGLFLGFLLARLLGMEASKARAVAIEIGMQNSGLGVAIAKSHFGVIAALPSAIFSAWHNISGSVLAWWWRRCDNDLETSRI
jgi:BASS family bile acid:Na+ symporter